jgi:wyosine [tRNA(Phe)-imidazoG37] synthetase (radical SAM superfamily)
MTITYPSPIFGPVKSRRLGISLGINLMPGDGKWCSIDCLYCECGLNKDKKAKQPLPSVEEVKEKLEAKLKEMSVRGEELNVLTFSGNGEPTMHPSFLEIVENVIILRNEYYPEAKVSVLSNSTQVHRKDIFEALMKVDNALMKLDTVSPEYIKLVDQPNVNYNIENIIDCLEKMKGHAIIQTMFMKGNIKDNNGKEISVDNCKDEYIIPYIDALKRISPKKVMIYTLDREWPTEGLIKASKETMDSIAEKIRNAGFETSVSY